MAIIFLATFIVGKESIKIFIKEENQKVNFSMEFVNPERIIITFCMNYT